MLRILLAVGGISLILFGIFLGLYMGIWVMLIGGIVQVIDGIKNDFHAMSIAIGVVRVLLTSVVGWLSAFAAIIPGFGIATAALSR